MSYSVIILPKAQANILQTRAWYENESPGLGDRFWDVLHQALLQYPSIYTPVGKEARMALVKRFPYKVFFIANEAAQRIEIVAVVHNKRHPRVWKRRL